MYKKLFADINDASSHFLLNGTCLMARKASSKKKIRRLLLFGLMSTTFGPSSETCTDILYRNSIRIKSFKKIEHEKLMR